MVDPDSAELIAKVASETVVKVIDSEPVNNLFEPVTKELGLALGEVGSVLSFYVSLNLHSIFKKWSQQRQGKPITSEQAQRVLPFLPTASLQSDEELQDRWATLLESAATNSKVVLPSFGQTLAQLSAEEARYLLKLVVAVTRPNPKYPPVRGGYFEYRFMMYAFDSELPEHLNLYYYGAKFRIGPLTRTEHGAKADLDKLNLMVQDLQRLGILGLRTQVGHGRSRWVETDETSVEVPGEAYLSEDWHFTPYGKKFLAAVTPRKS